MKKAVIFDLDGLLIDSEIISYKMYADLLQKHNLRFTLDTYARHYSGKNGVTNMQNLIFTYHLPISLEQGLAYVDALEKGYFAEGVPLKPGARELLHFLKRRDIKILLASSSTRERALSVLAQHGIENCFDAMVFGPEIAHGKPAPDIFLLAAQRLGCKTEGCWVIEDSYNGVTAAKAAGMHCIGFYNPHSGEQDISAADCRITHIDEAMGILGLEG